MGSASEQEKAVTNTIYPAITAAMIVLERNAHAYMRGVRHGAIINKDFSIRDFQEHGPSLRK